MNLSNVILVGEAESRPAAGVAGRLFFASDELTVSRDNGAAWDDVTPVRAGAARIHSASIEAQTDVTITHDLGTENVVVQIYDDAGMQTLPETCSITDEDNVRVTFDSAFTGKVVILG